MVALKDISLEACLLAGACRDGRLGFGYLLTPQELRAATRDCGQTQKLGGWCLWGSLHPAMYASVEKHGLQAQQGHVVTGPGGHTFFVLAQQAGTWQHRFVWAMYGDQVNECLRSSDTAPLNIALNTAGNPDSLFATCALTLPEPASLAGNKPATADLICEQAIVAMQMLWAKALRIDEVPLPHNVCVSIVQMEGDCPGPGQRERVSRLREFFGDRA